MKVSDLKWTKMAKKAVQFNIMQKRTVPMIKTGWSFGTKLSPRRTSSFCPSNFKRPFTLSRIAVWDRRLNISSRPPTFDLTRLEALFETIKRTRDADWAGTYHCEVKNLVGGAVSRNVTVSSAYIRKNFLRDPRNGLLLFHTLVQFSKTPQNYFRTPYS